MSALASTGPARSREVTRFGTPKTLTAAVVGVGLYVAAIAHTLAVSHMQTGPAVDPGLWPRIALLLLAASFAASLRTSGAAPPDAAAVGPADRPLMALTFLVGAIVYVVVVGKIGFLLATTPFLALVAVVCGLRGVVGIGMVSIGTTLGAFALFAGLLGAPLPRGTVPAAHTINSEAAHFAATMAPW